MMLSFFIHFFMEFAGMAAGNSIVATHEVWQQATTELSGICESSLLKAPEFNGEERLIEGTVLDKLIDLMHDESQPLVRRLNALILAQKQVSRTNLVLYLAYIELFNPDVPQPLRRAAIYTALTANVEAYSQPEEFGKHLKKALWDFSDGQLRELIKFAASHGRRDLVRNNLPLEHYARKMSNASSSAEKLRAIDVLVKDASRKAIQYIYDELKQLKKAANKD